MIHEDHRNERIVSIRDIARRAGVSITTVSHALSGKRHVAPETVQRIRSLVPELGYVPYAAARNLQAGKSLIIGLVVPDIANQFFGGIAKGVEEIADEREYGVVLCSSQADLRREKRYFNMLRSRTIDGLIYIAGADNHDRELAKVAEHYAVVVADERIQGMGDVPFIGADHHGGGRLAGQHLKQIGHHQTAIITGPEGLASTSERLDGYREYFPDARIIPGDFSEEAGRVAAQWILTEAPEVTAVFATNDLMALGVMRELASAGLTVPDDVSVIGFDDVDMAAWVSPTLTSVRQPTTEIGELAAMVLMDDILEGKPLRDVSPLSVQLVQRASTGPPPAAG